MGQDLNIGSEIAEGFFKVDLLLGSAWVALLVENGGIDQELLAIEDLLLLRVVSLRGCIRLGDGIVLKDGCNTLGSVSDAGAGAEGADRTATTRLSVSALRF